MPADSAKTLIRTTWTTRARHPAPVVACVLSFLFLLSAASLPAQTVFSPPAKVTTHSASLPSTPGFLVIPELATDGAGNWITMFNFNDPSGTLGLGTDFDMLFSRYPQNGGGFAPVFPDPIPLNTNAYADTGDDGTAFLSSIRAASNGAGRWVAIWASRQPTLYDDQNNTITVGSDLDIFVACSADNGQTWTRPLPLNNEATADA